MPPSLHNFGEFLGNSENSAHITRVLMGDPTLDITPDDKDYRLKLREVMCNDPEIIKQVDDILDLLSEYSEQEYTIRNSAEDILDRIDAQQDIWPHYKEILSTAIKSIPSSAIPYMERQVFEYTLGNLIEHLSNFPKFSEIGDYSDKSNERANDYYERLNSKVSALEAYAAIHGDESRYANLISGQVMHDQGGIISNIRAPHSVVAAYRDDPRSKIIPSFPRCVERVETSWDASFQMLRQIFGGNLAIVQDQFEMESFPLINTIRPAAYTNKARFGYNVVEDYKGENALEEKGKIIINIDPECKIYGHSDTLGMIFLNLIKNPLKIANDLNNATKDKYGKIAVVIEAIDMGEGCMGIYIKDSGPGLSYDDQRDHFTTVAEQKLMRNEPLTLIEAALLDEEVWRSRVTPAALNKQLFERGRSLAGGTGVGLDIVKSVAKAHQGVVQIYDHPIHGAGLQLLLPNTAETDPKIRQAMTDRCLIKQVHDHSDQVVRMTELAS